MPLDRQTHPNGTAAYHSPLLRDRGIPHGFTTRLGGMSREPYRSLNLGPLTKGVGDQNACVSENFRRVRDALGFERRYRCSVKQVHGCAVWQTPGKPTMEKQSPEADAIITQDPQAMLCIRVADCVPILIAGDEGSWVAAVHSGWRSTVANVAGKTIDRIQQTVGTRTEKMAVAIGPCISVDHFEVGSEVADAFDQAGLGNFVSRPDTPATGTSQLQQTSPTKPHVDLRGSVKQQLLDAGIAEDRIDTTDACTYANQNDFFSHRRDVTHHGQPDTGRMAALIGLPPMH